MNTATEWADELQRLREEVVPITYDNFTPEQIFAHDRLRTFLQHHAPAIEALVRAVVKLQLDRDRLLHDLGCASVLNQNASTYNKERCDCGVEDLKAALAALMKGSKSA